MTDETFLTIDLLTVLESAVDTPLWAVIYDRIAEVAYQAEKHGHGSDPAIAAAKAAHLAITEAAGGTGEPRACCVCDRPTSDHTICDRCKAELL